VVMISTGLITCNKRNNSTIADKIWSNSFGKDGMIFMSVPSVNDLLKIIGNRLIVSNL